VQFLGLLPCSSNYTLPSLLSHYQEHNPAICDKSPSIDSPIHGVQQPSPRTHSIPYSITNRSHRSIGKALSIGADSRRMGRGLTCLLSPPASLNTPRCPNRLSKRASYERHPDPSGRFFFDKCEIMEDWIKISGRCRQLPP
jgi:hypothetical protein